MRRGQYSVSAVQREQKLESSQSHRQGSTCCAEGTVLRQSRAHQYQHSEYPYCSQSPIEMQSLRLTFKHDLQQPLA